MASSYEEIMKTKPYLPFDMGGVLTEDLIAKAKRELGETAEVKAKTIPELRQLVQAESGLISSTDNAFLLQFLRARKFNVKKAFSLLKNLYLVKKSNADMFDYFDREALMRGCHLKTGFFLPYRDRDGCVIAVIKMRTWDVDIMNGPEAGTFMLVSALMCAQEPATQICGVRVLFDVGGATLKQIRTLVPRQAILMAKAFTNCLPIRFKGIHIYNESLFFHQMISVMKFFLTEKMKNRVHLHGDNQEHLYKYIPKAILPVEDFGGDNPNDIAAWYNTEMEKFFETYRQYITQGYK